MTSRELPPAAKPIREEAATWLLRKAAEGWGVQQQGDLDAWLTASEYNRAAYWRLEAAWSEATRLAALRPSPHRSAGLTRLLSSRILKTVAAGLLLVVGGIGSYHLLSTPATKLYATPVGGHRTLTLPDGTVIELNTDTVVGIANDLSDRRASLIKGEAFFQITHDAQRPFVVTVGDHKVTDLGTKFLITRAGKHVEVALLEGRARLDAVGSDSVQHSTELSPGEVATVTQSGMSVSTRPASQLSDELSWRKGLLIFDGTTLADAVADFNRYNVEKIVVRDTSIMRLKINGTFPVHAKQEFVDVARAVFGLRTRSQGNDTLITR